MMTSRRSLLAAGATGALALTSGCLDVVFGSKPLTFQAERVAPTDTAVSETGYSEDTVDQRSIDKTVSAGGVEREIHASLWTSIYTKQREYKGEMSDASLFAAVSVPGMEVAGRSFNPLEDLSTEDLLKRILERTDGSHGQIDNISHKESFSLEILGAGREVDVFTGETDIAGNQVTVEVALTSFNHKGDLIVLLGSYPELFAEESANVEVLMESADHPVSE